MIYGAVEELSDQGKILALFARGPRKDRELDELTERYKIRLMETIIQELKSLRAEEDIPAR